MNAEACDRGFTVSPAGAKGTSPICAVLKEFQSALADQVQTAADVSLCNFHTWLQARGAPAKSVAAFYLKVPDRSPIAKAASSECNGCGWILQLENARLRELVQQMRQTLFLDWMKKSQVSLCLDHGHKLEQCALLKMRPVILEIVERGRSELKRELGTFLEQVVRRNNAGGGILGRGAEFLVGQRGL